VYLVQILLPRLQRSGDAVPGEHFARTRAELVEAFDGITAYVRSPAQGLWTAPDGRVEGDDVVMVEVLVDSFDRPWWRAYATTLAARFEQESIHIRALPAEKP
jgi:hypothetical protein